MRRAIGWTWKAFLVLACVAYPYLVHFSVSQSQPGPVHLVLMWLPLAALACWAMVRSRNKPLWLAVLLAMGIVIYLLQHEEQLGVAAASGMSHAAAYSFLLWYFGRTLAPGTEPLITRFARRVHGALQPDIEELTRRLTVAWCGFFAAQLLVSALLFAFAPLAAWSLFVNVLNLPLLVVMFSGQWMYRNVRYPDCPRATIWQAIESFAKDASLSKSAELR